jgi:hypothetical protein
MSIEEVILKTVRELPPKSQQEILDHALRLRDEQGREPGHRAPRLVIKGVAQGLGPVPTAEDIDAVRREEWKNFPREDV